MPLKRGRAVQGQRRQCGLKSRGFIAQVDLEQSGLYRGINAAQPQRGPYYGPTLPI